MQSYWRKQYCFKLSFISFFHLILLAIIFFILNSMVLTFLLLHPCFYIFVLNCLTVENFSFLRFASSFFISFKWKCSFFHIFSFISFKNSVVLFFFISLFTYLFNILSFFLPHWLFSFFFLNIIFFFFALHVDADLCFFLFPYLFLIPFLSSCLYSSFKKSSSEEKMQDDQPLFKP